MTINITSHKLVYVRPLKISRVLDVIDNSLPRPRTVVATALLLGGLVIAILMLLGFLPLAFLMGFASFAMTATGGVLSLIFCGEI